MNQPELRATRRVPRRWLRRLLFAALVLSLLAAGSYGFFLWRVQQRLSKVLAETDRLDPGWRLEEMQASLPPLADSDNSALTIAAVKTMIPRKWPWWDVPDLNPTAHMPRVEEEDEERPFVDTGLSVEVEEPMPRADDDDNGLLRSRAHDPYAFSNSLRDLPPPRLMTKEQAARVREEMAGVQDVVELARKLAEQPRGRFRIAWSKDWRSTSIQQIHDAREVAQLLSYDALLRAHDGDLEGALHSCRAILNVSNAPRDTPSLIAQLIQIALRAIAKGRLERVLAHGEVRADVLAALQRHLEEAAEEPLFLTSLRGERAVMDRFYQAVQAGDVPIGDVGNGLAMHAGLFGQKPDKRLFAEELSLYLPGAVANNRAAYLERMNQLIEVARLAPAEQEERLKEIAAATKGDPILVRLFIPATLRIAEVCRRSQAELRCAAVALAAERYRQKHGRWPKELNNLVPDFLKDVPTDPFDGKPLRYRHDPAGVVIYSIGRDGKDDGGAFDTLNTHRDGTDIGFRLWHVEQRRQPPP